MKRFLTGTVGVIAMATSASAADLGTRPYTKAPAPIMAVAMHDWSGFYVGINGGGGWSQKCWEMNRFFTVAINPAINEGCHDATGGTVGGQIGYRWQASSWVFGVEAQGNWADFKGSNISLDGLGPSFTNRSTVDALGLFTGQVGYAWNSMLLYVKGGAAVTRDKYEGIINATGLSLDRATETRWGGVVGVGGEYAFSPNWSVAIEYAHLFMGSRDNQFYRTSGPGAGSILRTDRISQDVDMVTARLNYRFGGPVVAKY